ncbi:MAG: ATP-binding protein, partial [Flavobacterium sp.]
IVQYKVGDNLGAELTATRAYNIFNDLNDDKNLYQIFILLGNISEELKEFDKAVVYYTKALEKGSELEKGDGIDRKAICYNNIGFVHIKLNDHKKAIYNFNEGLKFSDKINQPDIYANLLDNLAYSKFKLNNQDGLPQMFFAALKIRDSLKFSSSIVLSHLHLSQYFAKNNDKIRSQKHVMVALQISRETKIPIDILTSLNQASEVDKANADEYSKEYIRLSDSLHIAERKSKDRFASLALQTDEIRQEKEVLAEKNRNLLLGFGITAIIAGLLFIVRLQRTRTRELLYKQSQQKANEEIYNLMISQQAIIDESREKEKKRLAQDLHDGILGRMFGLRLNLDSLNSFTDGETVQRRLELLSELKTIEQDIREISHDLNREKQVLINNFVSIVHNLLEEQQSFHEAKLNFSIDNRIDWDKVGNTVKINLYRILQECLQNINKYANAKNIGIKISREAENVALIISDDGVGFDVSRKSKGIGMQNMVSRTHECKGVIDVRSGRGNGTTILITIPIETNQLIEL